VVLPPEENTRSECELRLSNNRRNAPAPPKEFLLSQEKDNRLGYSLFRLSESVTLNPDDRFVVLPGERGKGWKLVVVTDAG